MNSEKGHSSYNDLKEQLQRLSDENEQLRSRNELFAGKLGALQGKLGQQAASTTDLSARLVRSEEDRLKISKELVEAQIAANNMREQYEAEAFELKNKMLSQEGVVSALEAERDRLKQDAQLALSRLQAAEGSELDLTQEYATLRRNYLALREAHEQEVTHSQELSAELLELAHTHDTLLRERERAHTHALEVERVRALIGRASQNRVRPEEVVHDGRNTQDRKLQDEVREELDSMRKCYKEQQHLLEEKIVVMGKELQENKRAIRNTQHEFAQQSSALISCQYQLKELESENSKLQNHLKELNQEYRARLTQYLHDVTEYMSTMGQDKEGKLRDFVDSMLQEVRVSYRNREQQLTTATRTYRKRLQQLNHTHQALLVAYRVQREQILVHTEHALDPGPPEAHFNPGEVELKGEVETELFRLREDKARLENQLRHVQEQMALPPCIPQQAGLTEEAWSNIRGQLRKEISTTQEAAERERAQLITRATVAEEQVAELQEYVDNHLGRYKLEVTRLRRMLGLEAGRAHSAEAHKPRPLRKPIKKSSCEI